MKSYEFFSYYFHKNSSFCYAILLNYDLISMKSNFKKLHA